MAFNSSFRRGAALVALVAIGLTAAGCTRIRARQGFLFDETLTASIQPGVDNRDSVAGTLGRPSFVGQFDQNDWYYISRDTRQLAFASPRPTGQTVLHVRFDQAGNVASVDRTGMEKVASIEPSKDKTPTLGRDRSFFQELFGNIGTVGGVGQGVGTADNPN